MVKSRNPNISPKNLRIFTANIQEMDGDALGSDEAAFEERVHEEMKSLRRTETDLRRAIAAHRPWGRTGHLGPGPKCPPKPIDSWCNTWLKLLIVIMLY